jgi:hypothetical protein
MQISKSSDVTRSSLHAFAVFVLCGCNQRLAKNVALLRGLVQQSAHALGWQEFGANDKSNPRARFSGFLQADSHFVYESVRLSAAHASS